MKIYELMVIISGALTEEQAKKVTEDVEKVIKAKKGTVTALDEWGKRKLAYPIKKQDFGFYNVWRFTSETPSTSAEIQNTLKINDQILRSLITLAPAKKKPAKTETKKPTTQNVSNEATA